MAKFAKDSIDSYFNHGVDLTNRRVFVGDINEDSISTAIKALYLLDTESKTTPCELFISSFGGELHEALALYDIIQTVQCPVHTFSFGKCMSAAPLLLAAGEPGHRWVSPHAFFMHHDWSAELEGRGSQIKADMKHLEQVNNIWIELLAKHSNKEARFWKQKAGLNADFYFTAEDAIDWGIADEIWSEKD